MAALIPPPHCRAEGRRTTLPEKLGSRVRNRLRTWQIRNHSAQARGPLTRFATPARQRNGPLQGERGAIRVLPDHLWTRHPFAHCDPAGIVYFASHFDILNGVVEDWFGEGLGLDYHDIVGRRRVGLGYVHASADFRLPARMGDRLDLCRRGRAGGDQVAAAPDHGAQGRRGGAVGGAGDRHHRPRPRWCRSPIPDDIRAAVSAYREKTA